MSDTPAGYYQWMNNNNNNHSDGSGELRMATDVYVRRTTSSA
ncbi:MAG: hypothetical protein N0C90_24075 [Candidatus Thiodiazotropha endolucinida]|nr:hypothetical protein [Candidatus Thiodiazotropha endolucinida]